MTDNNRKPVTTHDIMSERREILTAIEAAGGELTDEVEARLLANAQALVEKADAIQWAIDRLEADEAFLKAQAKRLSDAAKVRGAQVDRIKKRVKHLMREFGVDRIGGGVTEFVLSRSRPKLVGDGVPVGFEKTTIVVEADTDKIREALAEGLEVPGYHLEPVEALRINVSVKPNHLMSDNR